MNAKTNTSVVRKIVQRTRGHGHGPIVRLMSPSGLGQIVKPFVFLDIFDADRETVNAMAGMPVHPHSGVATVTVPVEGRFIYNDPAIGSGTLGYGGVEWMMAGSGVWHGKELSADNVDRILGFQLWLSMPPEFENDTPVSKYIESTETQTVGPAHIIVGNYQGVQSTVPAPTGINYLLVTLSPGDRWMYEPPAGHSVGWLALAKGSLKIGSIIDAGEMAIFESGESQITLESTGETDLGSALPHPYDLHMGYYSVHTSSEALRLGEQRIVELGRKLKEAGNRKTESGTIPVFR